MMSRIHMPNECNVRGGYLHKNIHDFNKLLLEGHFQRAMEMLLTLLAILMSSC
jgi:hypothetical protein